MFDDLDLNPILVKNIRRLGYTKPTPIQTCAVPPALEGLDVVATAETGSGKTAAFLLPLFHRLLRSGIRRNVRSLILCPTREMALQTDGEARKIGYGTGIRSTAIYGGVGFESQIRALKQGADIIVATPGRLLDLIGRGNVHLKGVQTLVLDEADRMLDMGFLPDIKRVLSCLSDNYQTLLYSATMPAAIRSLAEGITRSPEWVTIGRPSTPPCTVTQAVYQTSQQQKTNLLVKLLRSNCAGSVLVFTRTKHRADRVAQQLTRAGFGAATIHGNRSQRQREAALEGFRRGRYRVLVATDIAARGLDVQGITHVVNYDLPSVAEDYVHRIGRTARAGAAGHAVSLVTLDDSRALLGIERALGRRIDRAVCP